MMPLCTAPGCGKTTAELRCGKCQAAFYCDSNCQKADWRRHKKVCKAVQAPPSQDPAGASSNSDPSLAPEAPVSLAKLDKDFGMLILHAMADAKLSTAEGCMRHLPDYVQEAKRLLRAGAKANVRVRLPLLPDLRPSNVLIQLCPQQQSHLEPLLETILLHCAPFHGLLDFTEKQFHTDGSFIARSPLAIALLDGRLPLVLKLLAAGADPRRPCYQDRQSMLTPLHLCSQMAARDPSSWHRLEECASIAGELVAAGANVNARDPFGRTPLLVHLSLLDSATIREHAGLPWSALALRLIELGADVHTRDSDDQTRPLDHAAAVGLVDVMRALVAKGADPTPVLVTGKLEPGVCSGAQATSHYLQFAISDDLVEVLWFAAGVGVDLEKVRTVAPNRLSMLALACRAPAPACVRFLLDEAHVRVNASFKVITPSNRKEGRITATDFALLMGHPQVVSLMRAAGGKTYEELQAEHGNGVDDGVTQGPQIAGNIVEDEAARPSDAVAHDHR